MHTPSHETICARLMKYCQLVSFIDKFVLDNFVLDKFVLDEFVLDKFVLDDIDLDEFVLAQTT